MDELVDFISELNPPVEDIDWNFDTLPYVDMVKISSREPGLRHPGILCSEPKGRISACKRPAIFRRNGSALLKPKGIATCWQGSLTVTRENDFPRLSLCFRPCLRLFG